MRALQAWVDQRAERMLFLYGENDPFTAAAFRVPSARDNHLFLVPGGNHFAKLADLPEAQRARAHARIRAWAAPQL